MAKKDNKNTTLEMVEELAKKLLSLMSSNAEIEVSEDKENEAIRVVISSSEETGLLIGGRGETLLSIQSALGMMIKQKSGDWVRIIVDIGDWREKQEEHLKNLAYQTAERARDTKDDQTLYNLSASQRRIIHLALSNEKDIETESIGEGEGRYLIIKPVKK